MGVALMAAAADVQPVAQKKMKTSYWGRLMASWTLGPAVPHWWRVTFSVLWSCHPNFCFVAGLVSVQTKSISPPPPPPPHATTPSLSPPADINSEHRRRSVVIIWDFFPSCGRRWRTLLVPTPTLVYSSCSCCSPCSATTCLLKCIMSFCAEDDRQVKPWCEK